jgi:ABC-type transport system involved in cytochrome bd biosynthesis fused ATPase/permease subunit
MAVTQFTGGRVSLQGCLLIILLAADFFIPMRQLGSYFHIAMNGMAASDKIFHLLDLPEPQQDGKQDISGDCTMICQNVSFSYEPEREVLHHVDMTFPMGSFTALVGESGCGKSTIATVIMGRNKDYTGSVTIGGTELTNIAEESLMKNLTYISHQSYLFKGTVRENLLMGKTDATEEEMWRVLDKTKLADFIKSENGLDTLIQEKGSNLSGGQCQRLALARALLHDSPVYIFDEATSNVDVESENDIMEQIHKLAETKTVILISHRLANVAGADHIYVMEHGCVVEDGTHETLRKKAGVYEKLWTAQQELENYAGKGGF